MSRTVSVVAHSHWDREWYSPFETYRLRLVAMMDGLLDLLEGAAGFTHFHLDGQVAMVDDYLAARPGARPRLERLIAGGRLSVGPFYVLMDEFCVSGETLVRNLQLGLERSRELGADPTVGYLPDMFGHVAQMPQILAAAGLGHAVVWRGVPAAVTGTGFWWEAPDGTRVRAEYLPVGYSGGAFLPADPESLVRRVAAHEAEVGRYLTPGGPLLLMNGGDHHTPQAGLPAILERANAAQARYRFRQVSLAGHLETVPTDGLGVWRGELRSGHRAPVLPGVLSNRVDVKQAAAAAEELLEKRAEPLCALWLPPGMWPADLDRAWLEMIRNSAHDSVCACSADEVGRAVLHRYDTARALAAGAVEQAAGIAGVALAQPGPAVLNPLPFARSGLVEVLLPGTAAPPGAQQLEAVPAGVRRVDGRGRDVAAILGRLTADGWLDGGGRAVAAALADSDPLTLTLDHDPTRPADRFLTSTMAEAWARAGAGPDLPLTVEVRRGAWQRVLMRVGDVPGWGWSTCPAPAGSGSGPAPVEVSATPPALDNGLVRVEVDPGQGTFSLNGVPGQNTLVEEGDAGDTYNFAPARDTPGGAGPVSVRVEVVEGGPLRAVIRVRRRFAWPAGLEDRAGGGPPGRPGAKVDVEVVSDLEVHAGEPLVRVTTSFDHWCRDHRVRVLFPLPRRAGDSSAECAFGTTARPAEGEGGPMEPPSAAFPSRRFVTAGGLTVTHSGLLEYELVDAGRALALTLLRATGIISRPWLATRPNVAGPPTGVRDTQMPGPLTFRYALAPDCPDPYRTADAVWTPLLAFHSSGQGHLAARGSRLGVSAPGAVVSSLRRRDGVLEMRVFNPSGGPARVALDGHRGWLVDLRGRRRARWEQSFVLRPGEIATARLDAASLD